MGKKGLVLAFTILCAFSQLQGQTLLFRVPYLSWNSPYFNAALSGSTGAYRVQTFIVNTALPDNHIRSLSVDGQLKRRARFSGDANQNKTKPRLLFTGGLSLLNYNENPIRGGESFGLSEYSGNIGFRIMLPNQKEKDQARNSTHKFAATNRQSKAFGAFSLEYLHVSSNLIDNSRVFNSDITFNSTTNNFSNDQSDVGGIENGGTFTVNFLYFYSIKDPSDDKPDGKPVSFIQAGYKNTTSKIETDFIDYRILKVFHVDFHSKLDLGDNLNKIFRSLSYTLSYGRIEQNKDAFLKFNSGSFHQNRGIVTLHYYYEKELGFDVGFEYLKGRHSIFLGSKVKSGKSGLFSLFVSFGFVRDNQGVDIQGDRITSTQVSIGYESWGRSMVKIASNRKSRKGENTRNRKK